MADSIGESTIKVTYGAHEFEASGTAEAVHNLFLTFKELVSPQPPVVPPVAAILEDPPPSFHKLVLLKGKTAFLKVATKADDTVLLLLLAQKQFLNNDNVSGSEIMNGLRESGVRIPRGDYILAKHINNAYVTSDGNGRKRRYRLTDEGVEHAQQVAAQLLSLTR